MAFSVVWNSSKFERYPTHENRNSCFASSDEVPTSSYFTRIWLSAPRCVSADSKIFFYESEGAKMAPRIPAILVCVVLCFASTLGGGNLGNKSFTQSLIFGQQGGA